MNELVEKEISRGEVWRVNFDPQAGAEMKGPHPAVVLSPESIGRPELQIIVPFTSKGHKYRDHFWMIPVSPSSINGLSQDSWANAFQVLCASSERFEEKLGEVKPGQLEDIANAVILCIGLGPDDQD